MSKGLGHLAGKSLLLRIIAAGMTYVFIIAMARMMSVADFGVVGTLMSAALLFSVIGCAGQSMAILRFVPPLIEAPDAPVPKSLIARAMRLALAGNTMVFVALVAGAFTAQAMGKIDHAGWIAFGLLVVPLTGVIDMQAHLARAYNSIVLAIVPKDILWRLISLLLIGGVFWLSNAEVSLSVALITLVAVLVALIIGQAIVMHRRMGVPGVIKSCLFHPIEAKDPRWMSARFPLWISSITPILFTNLDVVAAGVFIGPEAAALYFAANRIALVPGLFLTSYNIVVGPIFAGHFAAGRKDEMRDVARTASLQVFMPTLAVVAVLMLLATPVLSMFGLEFTQSTAVLRWLLLAALINSALGPNVLILNMCGEERRAMRAALWSICIGGTFVFLGAWTQDIKWLAIGTCAASVFMRLINWNMVRHSLGFSADALSAIRLKISNRSN